MFLGQGQGQAQGQGLPGTEEVDRWTDTDRPSGLLIPSHTDIHSRSPPSLLLPLSHSLTTTTTTPSHTPSQSHLLPLSQIPPPPPSPLPPSPFPPGGVLLDRGVHPLHSGGGLGSLGAPHNPHNNMFNNSSQAYQASQVRRDEGRGGQ